MCSRLPSAHCCFTLLAAITQIWKIRPSLSYSMGVMAVQLHNEINRDTLAQLTHYTLPTPLQSESTCSPSLLSARQLLLFLSFPSSHLSLPVCPPHSGSFLCFICIITASWLNLVKLSVVAASAAGGGRFSGSSNQYWGAMGPLWKSSGIKRCSAG